MVIIRLVVFLWAKNAGFAPCKIKETPCEGKVTKYSEIFPKFRQLMINFFPIIHY